MIAGAETCFSASISNGAVYPSAAVTIAASPRKSAISAPHDETIATLLVCSDAAVKRASTSCGAAPYALAVHNRLFVPVLIVTLLLTGCASGAAVPGTGENASNPPAVKTPEPEPVVPLDLNGAWKQTNSKSADSYQSATIAGELITVNWVNETDSTTALYWVGTAATPTDDVDEYSWTSSGDVAQMESALLASGDDTKDFTYADGKLMYELTALGVTMTVEMERQ